MFVDTSALLPLLVENDADHQAVAAVWRDLLDRHERLYVTNYVLVEACALIQRRLGMEAVRVFWEDICPELNVFWVEELGHENAVGAFLSAGRRDLSLVDCVSFRAMRDLGIQTAFTLDAHFAEQGFDCVPELDSD